MQLDFHYAVTYIVARCAGFDPGAAKIIAYSAQYVDDATNSGTVHFDNGAMYERTSSAHKTFDYRNFKELANHKVWIPFHFLPGNGGYPPGEDPDGSFIEKLVCRPATDNHVADDMIRSAIADQHKAYGLHRFGITMHVYVDTWAHQGFAGVNHPINSVREFTTGDIQNADLRSRLDRFKDRLARFTGGAAPPLGHGEALSAPDKPWLVWSYVNGLGQLVERDNPRDFATAAHRMCVAMQRYLAGDAEAEVSGLTPEDAKQIANLLEILTGDQEERTRAWGEALANGMFSCGAEALPAYIAKGAGSWKHLALGTEAEHDRGNEVFPYRPEFLRSDWKLFHDGLQAHRFDILHDVLPPYGICAA